MKHVRIFENFQVSEEAVQPNTYHDLTIEIDKAVRMLDEDPVAAALHIKRLMKIHPELLSPASSKAMVMLKPYIEAHRNLSADKKEEIKKALEVAYNEEKQEREKEKQLRRDIELGKKYADFRMKRLDVINKVKSGEISPEDAVDLITDIEMEERGHIR